VVPTLRLARRGDLAQRVAIYNYSIQHSGCVPGLDVHTNKYNVNVSDWPPSPSVFVLEALDCFLRRLRSGLEVLHRYVRNSRGHARIISGGVAPNGNGAAPQVLPLLPR
jgi:hypothetical protein